MAVSEALFQELAKALGRPSRAYRTAEAGLSIPDNVIGGYEQGLQTRQDVAKLKLLNTPLGQIFGSQENIPYGLHPTDTFGTLATVAGSMKDYVNPGVASSVLNAYSDTPTAPPANPSATLPPQQGDSPLPVGPNGKADLSQVLGAPAPSPSMPDNGALPPPITLPPGGMNKATMDVVLPAVKAQSEMRLKKQQMAAEESRFNRGQANEESRFERGHIAGAAEKLAPTIETLGGLNQFIKELDPLVSTNHPVPGFGTTGGDIARRLGGVGTSNMTNSMKIDDSAGKLSAILDKDLAGRFNQQEADLLKKVMVPTGNDRGGYAPNGVANYGQDKLNKLKAFAQTLNSGNEQAIRNMAAAMTGGQINITPPTSPIVNSNRVNGNTYTSEADVPPNLPKGTIITVNGRRAVIR